MNTKILGWMHERQAKVQMARAILDGAEAESRGLNEDEERRYSDLLGAADGLQGRIEREQDLERREAAMDEPTRTPIRPGTKSGDAAIGMDKADIRRYSLLRAINAMATGDWRNARLELEASQAVAKRLGFEPQGLFVPYDWQAANAERRDLVKGTATAGGHLVATDLLAQDFIELSEQPGGRHRRWRNGAGWAGRRCGDPASDFGEYGVLGGGERRTDGEPAGIRPGGDVAENAWRLHRHQP
jgi:predicted phage gp36 major capsid-like protein